MAIFITGASGYIGGSVAMRLVAEGRDVRGLVRDRARARQLAAMGITPVLGSLDDREILVQEARQSEGVINAADSDHRGAVEVLIEGLEGSGKPLLQTSGTGFLADDAGGEYASQQIYDDATFQAPEDDARAAIDQMVRNAARHGIRSAVLCNTNIYGLGKGPQQYSKQVPWMLAEARKYGAARYIGKGKSVWSNVHIDDVVDLYLAAFGKAPAGSFYFVENGEASFAEVAEAIADRLVLGEARSWSVEEAALQCGPIYAFMFGTNSRVRSTLARRELSWEPKHTSMCEWIRREA